ncbi:hypothetical protein BU24DRAFT_382905 [Aaosphaeria arxii CBS 175.79]|uniref:Inner centromere protein ARK-binding domain-containing protein n=1 Tax=Aaosphaeria arxii CBS 175.79 TaxID=1450172 RepID=A0A6A5Y791_9PLEO|nr:uncharacterized protein BU24DRAFT_382905 [Aaosphaeria arxii CBS 175.79]KAF2020897.1 hypothetical protein BU24DRAFT_382905 [Aaosphaeria arxii CBS 175.79]
MAAARSKAPAIGSAQWILDERHQSNDLVAQEAEDFGFTVRNELEWLNEHMAEIFAHNGQNNLDVFKTPGKLRGKTPRTARKKAIEQRQPLGDIFSPNSQVRPSPAQQSLKNHMQKAPKARFQIAEDYENLAPIRSPVAPVAQSPVRQLFSKALGKGKENRDSPYRAIARVEETAAQLDLNSFPAPPQSSPLRATQDTAVSSQAETVFTQTGTQSTQQTIATESFRHSLLVEETERRDTGDSFVSAKEYGSKNASKENLRAVFDDDEAEDAIDLVGDKMDIDQDDAQDTMIRHEISSAQGDDTAVHHEVHDSAPTPRVESETYTISTETHAFTKTEFERVSSPAMKSALGSDQDLEIPAEDNAMDDTVVHHDIEDQMDVDDDDDIRSPSDHSSPVKLVRKSSLTFASLPAREPLLAKKSMGNRNSRTSHIDQTKVRNSNLGRFTGGKSLGGAQYTQSATHDDEMDNNERPELKNEESEATKMHSHAYTKSIKDRINLLGQDNEPPKRVSQNVNLSQSSQPVQAQNPAPIQPPQYKQPAYPQLPAEDMDVDMDKDDEEDDWISPIRPTPAANNARPPFAKSYSADTQATATKTPVLAKPVAVSNPNLPAAPTTTTPFGSPTGKKNVDNGPISASKAKLYSALRAAKGILIGSSAASAQAKLDALGESPARPKLQAQSSSEDIFSSPKRTEKPGLFSHLRSPSKESLRSNKSKVATVPGSPVKEETRRTRSSSERERLREREIKERDVKEKNRAEERLKEMREREQSKAAAHYQKAKATAKTPVAAPPQNVQPSATASTKTPVAQQGPSRPGTTRMNTAQRQDQDSGDEMPPPPPPKSFLPTGTKVREPRRLVKASSKDTLSRAKPQAPQKIQVNLHQGHFPQSSRPASRAATQAQAPATTKAAPSARPVPAAAKPAPTMSKPLAQPKFAPSASKPAPRIGRPQAPKAVEKPKPAPTQPRADLGTSRPVTKMQTVQDPSRINIPPVNPAKPAKRPFAAEKDEPLHRPAKRPSQQAKPKTVPMTPAHAQFAHGKIPFAEPSQPAQPAPPTIQYPNGEDIKLPDVMTDSEDEDSDNEFEQPSWVNTPNLREMLEQQQLVDPEAVFGPIAPLNMEQVFPNKERHKKFRDRTSSAFWGNDQVTEEEKRKEREGRERIVRDGAWTYNPSPRPTPRPTKLR